MQLAGKFDLTQSKDKKLITVFVDFVGGQF
jgi:hypothetical protein